MKQKISLNTLKQSLAGLPADLVDDIVRDYEQHFIDGMGTGRGEDEIGRALGDPRKIASEFKAMTHVDAFQHKRSVGNFGRMAPALAGLAGFNLFVLPFLLIAPMLLFALFLVSASSVFGGTFIGASGLLNVDSVSLDHSDKHKRIEVVNFFTRHTRADLRKQNMHVGFEVPPYAVVYRESGTAADVPEVVPKDPLSRSWRALVGVLYITFGIGMFMLSRKVGGLLWAGLRKYVHAQANILRGTQESYA